MYKRLAFVALLCLGSSWRSLAATGTDLQKWLYCSQNLWVDRNIEELEALLQRASRAGYTHVLLADSKFARLGEMDARYFRNINRLKHAAAVCKLEIVPAMFPVGYSNDILWHDPNLAEALPARDAPFVVTNGVARLTPDARRHLPGGDFSYLSSWSWKDAVVTSEAGAAVIREPKGQNARIVQKLTLQPFRQYHVSVRIKTENFLGTPEIKVIAGNRLLTYNSLGVKPSQDWTGHHAVFHSLEHSEASLYIGVWDGQTGAVWLDDAILEEVGLLNLVRRPGAPLTVRDESGGVLIEGKDFDKVVDLQMGNKPWSGAYDVWHEPPVLRTRLPDVTRLKVSWSSAVTVYDGQATICLSEPRTIELLRDQARRMHAAWGAEGYMMSHDEIRVLNWCEACRKRNLDAGAILADNVRTCIHMLREINPGGRIYVWSDMFDPHHNAHKDYYLVRGDLTGSWEGLDKEVTLMQWNFGKRSDSLRWFASRGHRQIIAGYYDSGPEQIQKWLQASRGVEGIEGVMYTTWRKRYVDLEDFARQAAGRRGAAGTEPD